MRLFFSILLAGALGLTGGDRAVVITSGVEGEISTEVSLAESFEVRLTPELGDEVLAVELNASPGAELRVQQRFETSITIPDGDGPHWDLLGWRHGHTEWRVLEQTPSGRHALHPAPGGELPFPPVRTEEIVAEVRASGADERWARLAATCEPPPADQGPCRVAVSAILLRVQKRSKEGWETLRTLRIDVPMGC